MDINFKRNRTQEFLELGIDPLYNYSETDNTKKKVFQNKAEGYIITAIQELKIRKLLKQDAYDYLYSAFVSFFNSIQNICENNYSWATVELYYTVYYLLRAKLHLEGYAIFRATSMYFANIKTGEELKRINSKKHLNTHDGTIKLFEKCFGTSDIIYSNTVDCVNSVEWIKGKRELVNYLSVEFKEPGYFPYFEKFNSIDVLKKNTIKIINDNSNTLAFQSEFAILGIPLLLFNEIIKNYNLNIKNIFDENKRDYLLSIVSLYELDFMQNYLDL